jgi:hypothetical protein
MHSHATQPRMVSNPPLPHQPQAHFYGAPDVDFDLQPSVGIKAGERGYHFGFDKLPSNGAGNTHGTDTVVTVGYEGGLEVYSVSSKGLELLASLKGLHGGIHHAKILPWVGTGPGSDLFPLVAVVIHGPVFSSTSPEIAVQDDYDGVITGRMSTSPSAQPDTASRDASGARIAWQAEFYQTSVQVYSLKTSKLVGTLLEAPKIQLKTPITSPIFRPPLPTGSFNIKADEGHIVVSSGVTGEAWVYRQIFEHSEAIPAQFRCLGKLWTTLQQPLKTDSTQDTDRTRSTNARPSAPRAPIIALHGRWIAYCPAIPSSQIALRAAIPVPTLGKAPGLSTMTPPQLPSTSADVLSDGDSAVNRMMRDATQELISGAKWVGQQGWQALNNYWKGSTAPQPPRSPPLGSQPWSGSYGPRQESGQFPPTHGTMTAAVSKDPGIVAVVDIEALQNMASVHPLSTFSMPLGCSFLSFSPSGVALFTASTKGDVQTVWDLNRVQYTRSSLLQASGPPGSPTGPRVRPIAQFSRMTVARIVDVAWTRPHGERIAMVTERGTVHLLDMPQNAFTWPPPRRRTRQQETPKPAAEGAGSAVSYASSALTSAIDAARPLLARPRRSSTNIPQSTGGSIVEHASHGGKMIAAGISHSLGKTTNAISQLRHTGENRVALPSSSSHPGPSCVVWTTRRRHHVLYVLGEGIVRMFPAKSNKKASSSDKSRVTRLNRYKDVAVPALPADSVAPMAKRLLDPDEYLDLTEDNDAGNNTMVLHGRPKPTRRESIAQSSIPQAEIESSAPYQPFHTDRRVGLYEYENRVAAGALPITSTTAVMDLEDRRPSPTPKKSSQKKSAAVGESEKGSSAWAFGQSIKTTKLDTGYTSLTEEQSSSMSNDDMRALPPSAIERVMQHFGENDDQIVVTTRRRRGGNRSADQEDDGFFEDDCEVLDFADQRV